MRPLFKPPQAAGWRAISEALALSAPHFTCHPGNSTSEVLTQILKAGSPTSPDFQSAA